MSIIYLKKKGMSDKEIRDKLDAGAIDSDKSSEKGEINEKEWKND
jgi:hypothetical protein